MSGPTREEVERLCHVIVRHVADGAVIWEKDHAAMIDTMRALAAENAALVERLEAAEEDADLQKTAASVWQQASLKNQAALTEARAREASAWESAIEAAARIPRAPVVQDRIRALRCNPKEGV